MLSAGKNATVATVSTSGMSQRGAAESTGADEAEVIEARLIQVAAQGASPALDLTITTARRG